MAELDDVLTTQRLWLVPLRRELVQRRLEDDEFATCLPIPGKRQLVHFGLAWPGELLPLFGLWAESLADDDAWTGQWVVVGSGTYEAVGAIGVKGRPQGDSAEIGYGVIPDAEGIGIATESVDAVVAHLLAHGFSTVRAETAVANLASERVLDKAGFARTGRRDTDDDGPVITWERVG